MTGGRDRIAPLRRRLRRLGYQINDVGQTSTRLATGASALMVTGAIFLGGDDCIPAGPTMTPSSDTADETDVLSGPTVETLELGDTDLSGAGDLEAIPAADISDSDVGETGTAAMDPYRNVRFEVGDGEYEQHDMLEIYLAAEEAYGVPWEVTAALAERESTHGTHPGLAEYCSFNDDHHRAAGVLQMGVADCSDGQAGASSNAWGGQGHQTVEEREEANDPGYPGNTMPQLGEIPERVPQWMYFGIDGTGNGEVNAWDPWDNVMSGVMKIAYFAERAAEYDGSNSDQFTGAAQDPSPDEFSPLEWGLWRHDAGDNIHNVLNVASETYGWNGESDIQANPVSYSGGGEPEECLDPDTGDASFENASFTGSRMDPIGDCDPADAPDVGEHPNGQIPESALCEIRDDETLSPDAAVAFMLLDEAYEEEFGTPIQVNYGYRDLAGQEYQYRENPDLAAPPGTSNHGWGLAVDIGSMGQMNTPQYDWMAENAEQFGWFHPDWAARNAYEPWHWEFETSPTLEKTEVQA